MLPTAQRASRPRAPIGVAVACAQARPLIVRPTASFMRPQPARPLSTLPSQHAVAPTTTTQAIPGLHPPQSLDVHVLPRKILVANRGEIACRVMATCRAMGIATVAVYSDADSDAEFVHMADEAVRLGPAPSSQSYLLMDKVLDAAKMTGAEMIHPGYGFLSENAEFATRVAQAGLVFIGPPADAILAMGSKSASKDLMEAAGVPCVPGYHGAAQDDDLLLREADKVGYPVLIKPTAGGGGKGMKVAWSAADFPALLASAQREAQAGFGDPRVLLERWLPRPRHVEVQVISDAEGNILHLGTRDCSTQRRHQKVLEEAPAPGLDPSLLDKLGRTAVQAARAAGYTATAGTVEFLLDATKPEDFFFCEMNTRLQVEHPVTEAITGVDLVALQLQVASGRPLLITQEDVIANMAGHAFEARLYAEHPRGGYLPSSGRLIRLDLPGQVRNAPECVGQVGAPSPPLLRTGAVRVDSGVRQGDEVSVHYDPMIAKLIVTGPNRSDALRRLQHALAQCSVVGPHTNLGLLRNLAAHPALGRGEVETAFLDQYSSELLPPLEGAAVPLDAALAAAAWSWMSTLPLNQQSWSSPAMAGFRNTTQSSVVSTTFHDPLRQTDATVKLVPLGNRIAVLVTRGEVEERMEVQVERQGQSVRLVVSSAAKVGRTIQAEVVHHPRSPVELREKGERLTILLSHLDGDETEVDLYVRPATWIGAAAPATETGGTVVSPMPSRLIEMYVAAGDQVNEGDALVVLEAMKTEHVLRSPRTGLVRSVAPAAKGDLVPQGTPLVVLVPEDED